MMRSSTDPLPARRGGLHPQPDHDGMTAFRLDTTTRTLSIDGADVSAQVSGVNVSIGTPPDPAVVTVHLTPGGVVEGDGIIHTVSELTEDDLRAVLASWLRSLDPNVIQEAAKARFTSMNQTLTSVILEVLAEAAHGD